MMNLLHVSNWNIFRPKNRKHQPDAETWKTLNSTESWRCGISPLDGMLVPSTTYKTISVYLQQFPLKEIDTQWKKLYFHNSVKAIYYITNNILKHATLPYNFCNIQYLQLLLAIKDDINLLFFSMLTYWRWN